MFYSVLECILCSSKGTIVKELGIRLIDLVILTLSTLAFPHFMFSQD